MASCEERQLSSTLSGSTVSWSPSFTRLKSRRRGSIFSSSSWKVCLEYGAKPVGHTASSKIWVSNSTVVPRRVIIDVRDSGATPLWATAFDQVGGWIWRFWNSFAYEDWASSVSAETAVPSMVGPRDIGLFDLVWTFADGGYLLSQ